MPRLNSLFSTDVVKQMQDLEKSTLAVAKASLIIVENSKKLATQLNTQKATQKSVTEAQKQANAINKQLITTKEKLRTIEGARSKELVKQKQLLTDKNKKIKDEIKLNNSLKGSYDNIELSLKKNVKRYKEMSVAERKNSAEGKRLVKVIHNQDLALKKLDASMGRSQRHVGKYSNAFRGLAGAMGVSLGAAGIFMVLRGAIGTITDFGKQTSILAAILNKTRDEIKGLTDEAIRLAIKYPTLTKEVLELQTSYARLGFTQTEIIALTDDTIKGSIALNSELGDTAELVGAIVKAYDDLGATDAAEIMDILTLSTQKSSLTFEKLQTALPKVVGAANAMGISLARIAAEMSITQDATQDASVTGTSLRNIYIRLAKSGMSMSEALDQISGSYDKLTVSEKLFGVRAAITGLALSNNRDLANELEVAYNDAAGTIDRVSDTQMKNLAASIEKVSSAWQGFILRARESESFLMRFLNGVAYSLNKIGKTAKELQKELDIKVISKQWEDYSDTVKKAGGDIEAAITGEIIRSQQLLLEAEKKTQDLRENGWKIMTAARQKEFDETQIQLNAAQNEFDFYIELFKTRKQLEIDENQKVIDKKAKADRTAILSKQLADDKLIQDIVKLKAKGLSDEILILNNKRDIEIKEVEESIANETLKQEAILIINKNYLVKENEILKKQRDKIKSDEKKQLAIKADLLNKQLAQVEVSLQQQLDLNQRFIDGEITKTELIEQRKILEQELFDQQIANLETLLSTEQFTAEERAKIQSSIDILKLQGTKKEIESIDRIKEWSELSDKEKLNTTKKSLSDAASAFKEHTIAFRIIASAQTLITTYQSAIAAFSSLAGIPIVGPILGGIAAAAATVSGLAAVAKINSVKFADGTLSSPEGWATWGEQGRELYMTPSGEVGISPGVATPTYLEQGTRIWKNSETEKIIAGTSTSTDDRLLNAVIDGNIKIAKAIKNNKPYHIDKNNRTITERNGNHYKTYINSKIRD